MPDRPRLYICGAGNPDGVRLALRIRERSERWRDIVILDDNHLTHGTSILGVEIAGSFDTLSTVPEDDAECASMITRTTRRRWNARERILTFGVPPATLVSPDVDTAGVLVADDVVVHRGAQLGVESTIGRSSAILPGAVIGHEARVGEGCIVAPGAVVNARVTLGAGVYVGSNAVLFPEVTVGDWATIGAGAVIAEDLEAGAIAAATPTSVVHAAGMGGRWSLDNTVLNGDDGAARIRAEWSAVLGISTVSDHTNFFDAGGDSLKATRLVCRIRDTIWPDMTLVDLYRAPTIAALAERALRPRRRGRNTLSRREIRTRLDALQR